MLPKDCHSKNNGQQASSKFKPAVHTSAVKPAPACDHKQTATLMFASISAYWQHAIDMASRWVYGSVRMHPRLNCVSCANPNDRLAGVSSTRWRMPCSSGCFGSCPFIRSGSDRTASPLPPRPGRVSDRRKRPCPRSVALASQGHGSATRLQAVGAHPTAAIRSMGGVLPSTCRIFTESVTQMAACSWMHGWSQPGLAGSPQCHAVFGALNRPAHVFHHCDRACVAVQASQLRAVAQYL